MKRNHSTGNGPSFGLSRDFKHVLALVFLIAAAIPAIAMAYPGEQLLQFGANYIIAPLGIFALVLALAGSFFRPDLVKSAVYAVIICAVLFFVIRQAGSLMSALQS